MKFYIFFIKKFLKGKNKFFFTFENILSMLGIFIGVFSILIVSSVMNGFDKDISNRILISKPEIIIRKKDFSLIKHYAHLVENIKEIKSVKYVAPVVETELIALKGNSFLPVKCIGFQRKDFGKISKILNRIVVGSKKNFTENTVVIGMDLSLDLRSTVGEKIILSDIKGSIPTPLGLIPKKKEVVVAAIFRTGLPEIDKNVVYADLRFMKKFLSSNGVSFLQIKSKNSTKKTLNEIKKIISDEYVAEDWTELNSNLFNAIKLEKTVMMFVLFLMVVIAAFNMSGFLVKFMESKKYETGILQTMGLSIKRIKKLFGIYALFLGIAGAFFATVMALILLTLQLKYHFIRIPIPGLPIRYLPVNLKIREFIFVPLVAVIISYLSILYPLNKIKTLQIIKILREKE